MAEKTSQTHNKLVEKLSQRNEKYVYVHIISPNARETNTWIAAVIMCQAFLYKPHPTMCTGNTFVKTKTCHMNEESNISHNHGTSLKGEHESISGADQGGPALHQAVLQQISPTLQGEADMDMDNEPSKGAKLKQISETLGGA